MGVVTVHGDMTQFTIYATNEYFQQFEIEESGQELSNGRYTFELVLNEGVTLISSYYVNNYFQEKDFEGSFEYTLDSSGMIFHIDVESVAPERDVVGFNKLYKVDNTILTSIASERFVLDGDDLGSYIINILEIPFSLNDDVLGDENPIRLGSHSLTSTANEIIKDSVTIDFGSIHVPSKYNNSYDYMNTSIKLHLPYSNPVNLELEYVIGYDIGIVYIIDLYYGDVTVNISSSRYDKVIQSETFKIGRDIPFIRKIGGDTINQLSTYSGINNGVLTPYIEVIRNQIYDKDSVFKNDITVYDIIDNVSGFVTVENIMLNTNATTSEKDDIINQLRNGVYIK